LVRNRNFGQKSTFFNQKSKFLVKNQNFWSKIESSTKNRYVRQKSKVSLKIDILVKNRNLYQKLKLKNMQQLDLLVKEDIGKISAKVKFRDQRANNNKRKKHGKNRCKHYRPFIPN